MKKVISGFIKKKINQFLEIFGYNIISNKQFLKLYRTLDRNIKSIIQKENPLIFDVGAHKGESIIQIRSLFKNPIIHSFEPINECFDKLNSFKNKNTFINNFALGNKKQKKILNITNDTASSSIYELDQKSIYSKNLKIAKKQQINIDTLDNYIIKNKINFIDFLKLDVQGYEKNVLAGSKIALKKIFLIQVEIIFIEYYQNESSFFIIEKILRPFGFKLYSLSTPNFDENYRIKWLDALYINTNAK
jgi:FkbM family methyltransferase